MKMLLISEDMAKDEYFLNSFYDIAEKQELKVRRSIAAADTFIEI